MKRYTIREIGKGESPLLKNFLYEAIHQPEGGDAVPRDIIEQPQLKIYYEDFGGEGDLCMVAQVSGEVVGAAWSRILGGPMRGYGNIDPNTPELAISVLPPFRREGMGAALIQALAQKLKEKGYGKISLAVQETNRGAYELYRKSGFEVVARRHGQFIMIYDLSQAPLLAT